MIHCNSGRSCETLNAVVPPKTDNMQVRYDRCLHDRCSGFAWCRTSRGVVPLMNDIGSGQPRITGD